jgi:hypothetical protein
MNKQNQQGVIHHLTLIVMGIAVLGAISFAGFRVWQNKSNAAAAGEANIRNLISVSAGRNPYAYGTGAGQSYAWYCGKSSSQQSPLDAVIASWVSKTNFVVYYNDASGKKQYISSFTSPSSAGKGVNKLCKNLGR